MNDSEALLKIQDDPRFVYSKRFDYDIEKVEVRYPDGCPDHVIADLLMIKESEVAVNVEKVVGKLRVLMGVDVS